MTYLVKDLQSRYGVSAQTVLGWIRSGELRAVNVGRRAGAKKPRWRISQEALDAFEAARTAPAPAPRTARRGKATGVVQFY